MTLAPIIFLKQIYQALGQEEEIANLAVQYVWTIAPSVIFYVQAMAGIMYAESNKYTFASMGTLAVASLIHVGLVFMLVGWLKMGWTGICIATSA